MPDQTDSLNDRLPKHGNYAEWTADEFAAVSEKFMGDAAIRKDAKRELEPSTLVNLPDRPSLSNHTLIELLEEEKIPLVSAEAPTTEAWNDAIQMAIDIVREHQASEIPVNLAQIRNRMVDAALSIPKDAEWRQSAIIDKTLEALKPYLRTTERESVNQEAKRLIEILHGAMLGLQSMSNESAKPRFNEYIELAMDFLLSNVINDATTARESVDQDTVNLAANMESLLTMHDRSHAWEGERQKTLLQLRKYLIDNHWPKDGVPERAKYLLPKIEGQS